MHFLPQMCAREIEMQAQSTRAQVPRATQLTLSYQIFATAAPERLVEKMVFSTNFNLPLILFVRSV